MESSLHIDTSSSGANARFQYPASAGRAPSVLTPQQTLSPSPLNAVKRSPSRSHSTEVQTPINPGHRHHHHHHHNRPPLFAQVSDWYQQEMSHMQTLEKRRAAAAMSAPEESAVVDFQSSLERLGRILEDYAIATDANAASARRHRSLSATRRKGLQKGSGSDTEYDEGYVPSADAFLDNTKTLSYSGGEVSKETNSDGTPAGAWDIFKTEIVRLTHTLRLKGWRRLPLDAAPEIEVVRLSGALTNAVYVVSPPKNIREVTSTGLRPPKTPPA